MIIIIKAGEGKILHRKVGIIRGLVKRIIQKLRNHDHH